MLLFYIDESGTSWNNIQTPYFILAAVAIPPEKWRSLDSEMINLKRRLRNDAVKPQARLIKLENLEIKGYDIRRLGGNFFKHTIKSERVKAIKDIASLIEETSYRIFAVTVDKRRVTGQINNNTELYQLALLRLLDEIEAHLQEINQPGMLLFDSRAANVRTSLEDGRLITVYREWLSSRISPTQLTELPWFGYSAFYAGIQLADFAAYSLSFVLNETTAKGDLVDKELKKAYDKFKHKIQAVQLP